MKRPEPARRFNAKRGHSRTRIAAAVAATLALSTGITSLAEAATSCVNADVMSAVSLRVLQSDLMVVALGCGSRDAYNRFVVQNKDLLAGNGAVLRRHFSQRYGANGTKKLNRFITFLANQASIQRNHGGPDFCEVAAERFEAVLTLPPKDLHRFSVERARETGYSSIACAGDIASMESAVAEK
ncbi:hypothetical protein [Oceanibacterium hippocampi]|uniref:Uncharacterized protein n=1 Tax=Oceanibacterium hippocampi TaxID=745714 RepID=A0A1Y5TZY2_9PROT|nr:hypothetical protein [Oceanibacterium hippocampi]SLN77113.1 hypothetical protein OCH7691_04284 [Oceanibacterium hippocampi]